MREQLAEKLGFAPHIPMGVFFQRGDVQSYLMVDSEAVRITLLERRAISQNAICVLNLAELDISQSAFQGLIYFMNQEPFIVRLSCFEGHMMLDGCRDLRFQGSVATWKFERYEHEQSTANRTD